MWNWYHMTKITKPWTFFNIIKRDKKTEFSLVKYKIFKLDWVLNSICPFPGKIKFWCSSISYRHNPTPFVCISLNINLNLNILGNLLAGLHLPFTRVFSTLRCIFIRAYLTCSKQCKLFQNETQCCQYMHNCVIATRL